MLDAGIGHLGSERCRGGDHDLGARRRARAGERNQRTEMAAPAVVETNMRTVAASHGVTALRQGLDVPSVRDVDEASYRGGHD